MYPFQEDTTSCIAVCPDLIRQNMSLHHYALCYQLYTPAAVICLSNHLISDLFVLIPNKESDLGKCSMVALNSYL